MGYIYHTFKKRYEIKETKYGYWLYLLDNYHMIIKEIYGEKDAYNFLVARGNAWIKE